MSDETCVCKSVSVGLEKALVRVSKQPLSRWTRRSSVAAKRRPGVSSWPDSVGKLSGLRALHVALPTQCPASAEPPSASVEATSSGGAVSESSNHDSGFQTCLWSLKRVEYRLVRAIRTRSRTRAVRLRPIPQFCERLRILAASHSTFADVRDALPFLAAREQISVSCLWQCVVHDLHSTVTKRYAKRSAALGTIARN